MIILTDKIAVTADQYQYIVGTPVTRERDGKQVIEMRHPKYYTTLASAIKEAVAQAMRLKVADGTITELRQYLKEHQEITDTFNAMLRSLEKVGTPISAQGSGEQIRYRESIPKPI